MSDTSLARRINKAVHRIKHRDYEFIEDICIPNMCSECQDGFEFCDEGIMVPDCIYGCHTRVLSMFSVLASRPIESPCDDPECDHGMEQS